MTARPKLSVLVPTYNRRMMLAECLDSVLATAVDCEVVVCDDASSDGTAELLAQYAARDSRVRAIRQPANVGTLGNLASGFRELRGEYLTHLGDDDSALPGNYEKKVAVLDAHPDIDLVYSMCYGTDEHNRNRQKWNPLYLDHSYLGGRDEFMDLLAGNHIPGLSVVFRRKLYDERGGYDENMPPMLSDWELWLRYTYRSQTAFINEPLVNVRHHVSSLSQQNSAAMAMGMITVWRKWLVEREDPPVVDDRVWERMYLNLMAQAQASHPNQPDRIAACVKAFEQLRRDAAANVSRRFARLARKLSLADLDSSGSANGRDVAGALPALAWSGPVFGRGEDSADLRATALAAASAGVALRLENVPCAGGAANLPDHESEILFRTMWTPLPPNEYLQVCQSTPRYFDRPADVRASIGRTAWMTDLLPEELVQACNQMDMIWTPGEFQRDIFVQSGVQPGKLHALPGCLDATRYGPGAAMASLSTGRGFNFLALLDWAPASGWDVLVRAFVQEFRADEDVALVLVTQPPPGQQQDGIVSDIQQVIASQIGTRPSAVINLQLGTFAEQQLASLLSAAQAYVQPSRAASWGRSLMQAMASGLPVIATAWGATLDLITAHNGYPVECRLVDVPQGALPDLFDAQGHRWAEPSLEHLQARLREVFTNREEAAARGQRARADIGANYGPTAVAAQLRQLVAELA